MKIKTVKTMTPMTNEIMSKLSPAQRCFGMNGEFFDENGWEDTRRKTVDGKRIFVKQDKNFNGEWYDYR